MMSSAPVHLTPQQIVTSLGLASAVDTEAMASRACAFSAVHMGMRDVEIGTLLDLIRADPALSPPRTGHIGNWENIALGRSGAQDFNKAICAPGYGHPLLYCFTQTEAGEPKAGDWGYMPGSLVERDQRMPLRLHTWNGTAFAPEPHERPLFTPFAQAEFDGGLRPLIELHQERLSRLAPLRFRLEQAVIARHEDRVRPMLAVLIEDAGGRANHGRALQDLISHAVTPDGALTRAQLAKDGNGYRLGECYYPSAEALAAQAMVPFQAVAAPRDFFAAAGSLPPLLPVVSNLLTAVLSAVLQTHYPDLPAAGLNAPFTAHLHWGGRDMAGYPPYHRGYLFEDAKLRAIRRICTTLAAHFREVPPVCFVLLPAAVFMLCPADAHEQDAHLLAALFRRVRDAGTPRDAAGTGTMRQAIEAVARDWHDAHAAALSPYFLSRFGSRRGALMMACAPESSEPVEPAGFRDLTLRQASMITGALLEIGAATPPSG